MTKEAAWIADRLIMALELLRDGRAPQAAVLLEEIILRLQGRTA